jgi:hypothetical protein
MMMELGLCKDDLITVWISTSKKDKNIFAFLNKNGTSKSVLDTPIPAK